MPFGARLPSRLGAVALTSASWVARSHNGSAIRTGRPSAPRTGRPACIRYPSADPDYRPDCLGYILEDEAYVKYLRADRNPRNPWHGEVYCQRCAIGIWGE